MMNRFQHLTDDDIGRIQRMVDDDWSLLLRKAGLQ